MGKVNRDFDRVGSASKVTAIAKPIVSSAARESSKLEKENAQLRKELDMLKQVTMKVAEKGGLSVYGLGRFPVTLYKEQWITLLGHAGEISAFIASHAGDLKTKEGTIK